VTLLEREQAAMSQLLHRCAVVLPAGVVACLVLLLLVVQRQPGVPATDSVFAEDAMVFLQAAWVGDALTAISEPYAGYLHLVPRLIALLVAPLPPVAAAAALTWLSSAVLVLLSVFVVWVARERLPSLGVRIALGASVPLLPVALVEGLHSATNLHWFLLYGCFWALVAPATSRARAVAQGVVACAAVLSDPLAALFIPLLLIQVKRGRSGVGIAVAFCVATLLQAFAVLSDERTANASPQALELARAFVSRVLLSGYLGPGQAKEAYENLDQASLVLAVVVTAVVAAALGFRRDATGTVGALALIYSAVLFVACFAYNWTPGIIAPTETANLLASSRYSIAPTLLLLTTVAAAAQRRLLRIADADAPTRVRAGSWAFLVVTVLAVGTATVRDYQLDNGRATAPSWTHQVAEGRLHCSRYGGEATLLAWPEPFAVRVPCGRLQSD
jgi:hypothetical protein